MSTITINSMEDAEKYYDEKSNTYIFSENGERCDVKIEMENFSSERNIIARDITARNITVRNIDVMGINTWNIYAWNINAGDITAFNIDSLNINAWNLTALSITAWNINALDINAGYVIAENIDANDISYYAVCVAYQNIVCHEIHGRRRNSVHMALDGTIKTGTEKSKKGKIQCI